MTDTEKKASRYIRSVRRHLNLPKAVKERVMSDFESSIRARREAGMTEEAIFAELGTPKMAAADLNEQMKEYAYRKSPWRFLFLLAAVAGAWELLGSLVAMLLYLALSDPIQSAAEASSLGIIGGADGPTAFFVTTNVTNLTQWIVPLLLVSIGIWGYLRLKKCGQK